MGMRTIRWRSGATDSGQIPCLPVLGLRQCALSPFPACCYRQSLSEYRSSAWRLPLCQDAVRIMISWRHFVRLSRGECDDVQVASALGALGPRAHRAQELEKNLLFSAALPASAAAARRSRARRREVRALLCTLAVWKGRGCMISSVQPWLQRERMLKRSA